MPDYQTIRGISTFEYEEKRSRFIASAAFADTEEAALAHLNRIKAANRTARHNVYAYVLREGGRTRYSDDEQGPAPGTIWHRQVPIPRRAKPGLSGLL